MKTSEFTVESMRHCFICLDSIPSHFSVGSEHSPSIFSLSSLSTYLKMDMKKVFNDNDSIPKHLIDKVRKAKLRGQLCQECSLMNNKFSELYWKLVKIEMELAWSVKLIQRKFLKANDTGKNTDLRNLAKSMANSGDSWTGKLDILEVLRAEAIERCSQKLNGSSDTLRIKVQNMTMNQIVVEKQKFKSTMEIQWQNSNFEHGIHPKMEERTVKTELPFQSPMPNDINDSCYSDDSDKLDCFDEVQGSITPLPIDGGSGCNIPELKVEESSRSHSYQKKMESFKSQGGTSKNLNVKYSFKVVIPPESQSVPKPRFSVNPESGKHKCNMCPREFKHKADFKTHYESCHLRIKYNCNICGSQFTQLGQYKLHHQSIHVGVRFKCLGCNKMFTQKKNLTRHQRKFGCKRAVTKTELA